MPDQTRIVSLGSEAGTVRTADGRVLRPPADWDVLPPGDATLTRRVKKAGPSWTVQRRKGRKVFSDGVWAPAKTIATIRAALELERSTESYAKRQTASRARRQRKQDVYVDDFQGAILAFLNFAPRYRDVSTALASAVTAHATPVGSGTVARTERIPIEQRAESAVIAWLRHATTAYDDLKVARVKGRRREVRRELAVKSRRLLERYRAGEEVDAAACPLRRALDAPKRDSRAG